MDILNDIYRECYGLTGHNKLNKLKNLFNNYGLKLYGKNDTYIISSLSKASNPRGKYKKICNYIVTIDDNGFNIVARGVPAVFPPENLKEIMQNHKKYTIYPVTFGTVIILYYHNQKWKLATRRNPHADDASWISGGNTFAEGFYDSIGDFDISSLDTKYSYSFVLYRESIHLYSHPSLKGEALFFIGSLSNDSDEILTPDIGIPTQEILEINDLNKEMINNNNSKLGYILRTNNSRGNHIILKSALYKRIESFASTQSSIKDVIKMVQYKSFDEKKRFTELFPSLKEDLEELDNIMIELIDNVLNKNIRIPMVSRIRNALLNRISSDVLYGNSGKKKIKEILYNHQDFEIRRLFDGYYKSIMNKKNNC
jgi:hypothetical protein